MTSSAKMKIRLAGGLLLLAAFYIANISTCAAGLQSESSSTIFTQSKDRESGESVCFLDTPQVSLSAASRIVCNILCFLNKVAGRCTSFNYYRNNRTCNLYTVLPLYYGVVPECVHYQVN